MKTVYGARDPVFGVSASWTDPTPCITLTPTLSRKRERGRGGRKTSTDTAHRSEWPLFLPLPLAGEGWGEGPYRRERINSLLACMSAKIISNYLGQE
jgi:hypothetical protein